MSSATEYGTTCTSEWYAHVGAGACVSVWKSSSASATDRARRHTVAAVVQDSGVAMRCAPSSRASKSSRSAILVAHSSSRHCSERAVRLTTQQPVASVTSAPQPGAAWAHPAPAQRTSRTSTRDTRPFQSQGAPAARRSISTISLSVIQTSMSQ